MRATHPRTLLPLVGALVAIAGIVWGAGLLPHASGKTPAAPVAIAAPAPDAAVQTPVAAKTEARIQVAQAQPATVAGSAGMRIFKDPETGEMGLPTESASALETDSNSEDMTGLTQVTLRDGSVMIDLQGRFQESMVIRLDAKGNKVVDCTRHPEKLLSKTPAPTQTLKREER